MTASASTLPRRAAADPLRTVEAALLGTLFLGVVAMLSLPAVTAGPGWIPLWLVGAPATALATSFLLRLRRSGSPAPATTTVMLRRRPAMATRRRASPPRRTARMLAAIVLRWAAAIGRDARSDPRPPAATPLRTAAASAGRTAAAARLSAQDQRRLPTDNHDIGAASCEQADADHAWNLVELGLQGNRIGDAQVVDVEHGVAVVGDHAFAPHRLAAGPRQDL